MSLLMIRSKFFLNCVLTGKTKPLQLLKSERTQEISDLFNNYETTQEYIN